MLAEGILLQGTYFIKQQVQILMNFYGNKLALPSIAVTRLCSISEVADMIEISYMLINCTDHTSVHVSIQLNMNLGNKGATNKGE